MTIDDRGRHLITLFKRSELFDVRMAPSWCSRCRYPLGESSVICSECGHQSSLGTEAHYFAPHKRRLLRQLQHLGASLAVVHLVSGVGELSIWVVGWIMRWSIHQWIVPLVLLRCGGLICLLIILRKIVSWQIGAVLVLCGLANCVTLIAFVIDTVQGVLTMSGVALYLAAGVSGVGVCIVVGRMLEGVLHSFHDPTGSRLSAAICIEAIVGLVVVIALSFCFGLGLLMLPFLLFVLHLQVAATFLRVHSDSKRALQHPRVIDDISQPTSSRI